MYDGVKVIDCHGHMSTPPEFRAFAYNMVSLRGPLGKLVMSEELQRPALDRHIKMLDERRIDVQLISPRPVAMMHWERPFLVHSWTTTTNDVIYQQTQFLPDRFVGVAQLPQSREQDTSYCVPELERCVNELGFVAAQLNPDPGGDRLTPGMNDPYWFPLYERAEALQTPLIVHPSISRDPRLDIIPSSYQYNNVTEEHLAMLLLEHSDVFERFPNLRVVVCHCGGALSRTIEHGTPSGQAGGGSAGMPTAPIEHAAARDISGNLFVDSCAYDPNFLRAAIKQIGVDRIVFGSEAPGSGTSVLNPETNKPSDDLISALECIEFLSDADRRAIVHDNLLRVFPLLEKSAALTAK
jgi:predicted TIM-barrel fold metal-dependent hydrolase